MNQSTAADFNYESTAHQKGSEWFFCNKKGDAIGPFQSYHELETHLTRLRRFKLSIERVKSKLLKKAPK